MDDDGPWRPLEHTFLWALWGWRHEQARVRETLRWVSRWCDAVRILGEVNWSHLSPPLAIDSSASDHEQVLAEFIDCAYDEYGLRVGLTVFGGPSPRDPIVAAQKVARVVSAGRQQKILYLEGSNEYRASGPSEAQLFAMLPILKATGCPVAASSPDANAEQVELPRHIAAGATIGTVHLDRTYGQHGERMVRQPYGLADLPMGIAHNEPIGPRSSGEECVDQSKLAMLRAMGIFCGAGQFTLHNGNAVTGRPDPGHNRLGDPWSVPGIDAIMDAVKGVDRILPVGVEHWSKVNQHGGWSFPGFVDFGQPLAADAIWSDGHGRGCDRCYGATDGMQFATIVSDVVGSVTLRARQACQIDVYGVLEPDRPAHYALGAGHLVYLPAGDHIVVGRYA